LNLNINSATPKKSVDDILIDCFHGNGDECLFLIRINSATPKKSVEDILIDGNLNINSATPKKSVDDILIDGNLIYK
jgi:hypothetical protein